MELALPPDFDTIVIGGGASGIAAAIYCVRKNLQTLMVAKNIGGQASMSGEVDNYPGFSMISGIDLARKFKAELISFEGKGLWIKEGVEVVALSGGFPNFLVKTANGGEYKTKTIIIASGSIPKMLGIPGEKELLGKGVSTCATCDAPFFKNKEVAVIGGGNCALDSAYSLLRISRKVTIVNINDSLKADEVLINNVTTSSNVEVLNNHETLEILGTNAVGGLRIKNRMDGKEEILTVSGVFIEIGRIPSSGFDHLTEKNEKGEIKVDQYGASSIPGIYAAGDVNDQKGEQIIIAAGEGAKSALAVSEYLSKQPQIK